MSIADLGSYTLDTDGVSLLNSNAVFDTYVEGTLSTSLFGPYPSTVPIVIKYTKYGKQVTVHFPKVTAGSVASSGIQVTATLPVGFRPNGTITEIISTIGGALDTDSAFGTIQITSGGVMVISFGTPSVPFPIALSAGFFSFAVSFATSS